VSGNVIVTVVRETVAGIIENEFVVGPQALQLSAEIGFYTALGSLRTGGEFVGLVTVQRNRGSETFGVSFGIINCRNGFVTVLLDRGHKCDFVSHSGSTSEEGVNGKIQNASLVGVVVSSNRGKYRKSKPSSLR